MTAKVYLERDEPYRNPKILASARGETCTVNGPTCNRDQRTTVWAHSPYMEHGKSGARKAHDCFGCFACSACHDFIDFRVDNAEFGEVKPMFMAAMVRSWLVLLRKGVLK